MAVLVEQGVWQAADSSDRRQANCATDSVEQRLLAALNGVLAVDHQIGSWSRGARWRQDGVELTIEATMRDRRWW
jgi:hypothetical protein